LTPEVLSIISSGGAGVAVIVCVYLMTRHIAKESDKRRAFEKEAAQDRRMYMDKLQQDHTTQVQQLGEAHADRMRDVVKTFKASADSCHEHTRQGMEVQARTLDVLQEQTETLSELKGYVAGIAGQQASGGPGRASGEYPMPPPAAAEG
jgi:hypothetical protein